jgi:hypothetical protein
MKRYITPEFLRGVLIAYAASKLYHISLSIYLFLKIGGDKYRAPFLYSLGLAFVLIYVFFSLLFFTNKFSKHILAAFTFLAAAPLLWQLYCEYAAKEMWSSGSGLFFQEALVIGMLVGAFFLFQKTKEEPPVLVN